MSFLSTIGSIGSTIGGMFGGGASGGSNSSAGGSGVVGGGSNSSSSSSSGGPVGGLNSWTRFSENQNTQRVASSALSMWSRYMRFNEKKRVGPTASRPDEIARIQAIDWKMQTADDFWDDGKKHVVGFVDYMQNSYETDSSSTGGVTWATISCYVGKVWNHFRQQWGNDPRYMKKFIDALDDEKSGHKKFMDTREKLDRSRRDAEDEDLSLHPVPIYKIAIAALVSRYRLAGGTDSLLRILVLIFSWLAAGRANEALLMSWDKIQFDSDLGVFYLLVFMPKVSRYKYVVINPSFFDMNLDPFKAMADYATTGAFNHSVEGIGIRPYLFPSLCPLVDAETGQRTCKASALCDAIQDLLPTSDKKKYQAFLITDEAVLPLDAQGRSLRAGAIRTMSNHGLTLSAVMSGSGHADENSTAVGEYNEYSRSRVASVLRCLVGWPAGPCSWEIGVPAPQPPSLNVLVDDGLITWATIDMVCDSLYALNSDYVPQLCSGGPLRRLVHCWLASQLMYFESAFLEYGPNHTPNAALLRVAIAPRIAMVGPIDNSLTYPDKCKRAFVVWGKKIRADMATRNTCITDGSEKGGIEALAASYKDELQALRKEKKLADEAAKRREDAFLMKLSEMNDLLRTLLSSKGHSSEGAPMLEMVTGVAVNEEAGAAAMGGGEGWVGDGSEEPESSAVLGIGSPGVGNFTFDFNGRTIGDVVLFLHLNDITSPGAFNPKLSSSSWSRCTLSKDCLWSCLEKGSREEEWWYFTKGKARGLSTLEQTMVGRLMKELERRVIERIKYFQKPFLGNKINSDATDKLTKLRGFTVTKLEDAITDMDKDVALLSKVKLKMRGDPSAEERALFVSAPPFELPELPELPKESTSTLEESSPQSSSRKRARNGDTSSSSPPALPSSSSSSSSSSSASSNSSSSSASSNSSSSSSSSSKLPSATQGTLKDIWNKK